ncbi:septum formation initiator family protein [bacterium]|nr:septum formation initiator family protein [bacterium]
MYLVFNRDSGLLLILDLKDERDRLQHEVERLKTEKTELEHQIQRLEAVDPMVIEEEARRKGMVREGEEVYRLKYQELPDSGKVDKRPQTLEGR